jgi:hypothetical protein
VEGTDVEFVARFLTADGSLTAALAAYQPAAVGQFRRELAPAA